MKKFIILPMLVTISLFAATIKDNDAKAILFLKSNQIEKAYALLTKMYSGKKYDNETLFLLGKVSDFRKNFVGAMRYYEELLSKDPNANRVKLELATIYYRLGSIRKAKELLLEVKSLQPPKKVGDNIDEFLALINKNIPKNWGVNMSIGYLYDSNANQGPNIDTVLMYNLPFTLSNDAKQNSDHAKQYNINMYYEKQFEKFSLQTNFSLSMVDYNDLNNLDSTTGSLSLGPTWKKRNILYSFPFVVSIQKIGHQKKYYTLSKGISPQFSYHISPKMFINAYLSFQNKKYYKNAARRSNAVTFSPSLKYYFNQTSYGKIGGYIGKEKSKTDINTNVSKGLNVGYFKALAKNINIYLSGSISLTRYSGEEIAYNKSRKDNSNSIGGNLSYFYIPLKINFSLNISYTYNHSNITMYQYTRNQISLSISKSF